MLARNIVSLLGADTDLIAAGSGAAMQQQQQPRLPKKQIRRQEHGTMDQQTVNIESITRALSKVRPPARRALSPLLSRIVATGQLPPALLTKLA